MKNRYLRLSAAAMLAVTAACSSNPSGSSAGSASSDTPGSETADAAVSIKTQPQDVTVHYPEGASFSVEVENPQYVSSYQWICVDIEGQVFELQGITARTDTLVIPSTVRMDNDFEFYCIVTDKDGNKLESEHAMLSKDNRDEDKPVLYIGSYALEPGQSLDLAEADIGRGTKLGSGTVDFDANGSDITFTDVNLENSNFAADIVLQPNVGISLEYNMPETKEYNIIFHGDNNIMNTYYDADYNASGIPFDFYFTGETELPLVNFIGDGTLTVSNGSNVIRVCGDLLIDIDLNVRQTDMNYSDAIVAENLKVCEGRKLEIESCGSALYAKGNILLEGADITVRAHAPHISVGAVSKNVVQSGISLVIDHTVLDVTADTDPEIAGHILSYTGISSFGDMYIQNGSEVSYQVDIKHGDELYTSNFQGIVAENLEIEDSSVSITIDSEDIYNSFGVYAGGYVQVTGSKVNADIHTTGLAYGIAPEGDFSADNSEVTVNVSAYDTYEPARAYGIMCENAVFRFEDKEKKVTIDVPDGIALGCNLHQIDEEEPVYTENYESKNVFLREGAACLEPENTVISTGGTIDEEGSDYKTYLHLETFYDPSDTSRPLEKLVFGLK